MWEGLSQHAWTEPQLAAFQHELTGFNLLADYTNAVNRTVLAHIEVWRAIADGNDSPLALAAVDNGYRRETAWQLQPRAWWFEGRIRESLVKRGLKGAMGRVWSAWGALRSEK